MMEDFSEVSNCCGVKMIGHVGEDGSGRCGDCKENCVSIESEEKREREVVKEFILEGRKKKLVFMYDEKGRNFWIEEEGKDYGVPYESFVIECDFESDCFMVIDNWLEVRCYPGNKLDNGEYYVKRVDGREEMKIGVFDIESLGLLAESYYLHDDDAIFSLNEDEWYNIDVKDVEKKMMERIFEDKDLGEFERKVRGWAYNSCKNEEELLSEEHLGEVIPKDQII